MTGQILKVESAVEPWVSYLLEDGTTLRFRFTACQFRRTGAVTALGEPEYSFGHGLLIETVARPSEVVTPLRAVGDSEAV